ncbi:MAG TPA: NAD-dependent epimerase/dehydratase family protein [Candidatus Binataceae bacterium]|nr:NAD-dependent epimerase/dehydratase family protein [Candidatus Binataceae bacterium]
MRILVTGGAGFIGSHTVDMLTANSHDVAVVDDLSNGKRERLAPNVRFHHADIRNADEVRLIIDKERPEVLMHIAAQLDVRKSVADPAFDAEVNIGGFLNLIEAGREKGLRRVIFSSTGGAIYGEQEQFPCDEAHRCRPLSPYGVSKLATEAYLFFYNIQYGIEYVALRYSNVYGPRQDPRGEAGVVAIFCGRMLSHQPCTIYGDGEQTRDYVYVGDVARANLNALNSPVSGAFNIGTGLETSVNQLFRALAGIAGVKADPIFAAARPGEQRRSVISPARAAAEIDWRPEIALEEGLRRTFDWFQQNVAE